MTLACTAYGQNIAGTVTDKLTRQPVIGATVSLGNIKTTTNQQGVFLLVSADKKDSLYIRHINYKTYSCLPGKGNSSLHIELDPARISLNTVTIHGERNFKQDSINNRMAYAKQFDYTGPKVKDIFSTAPKQTGELLSINLLALVDVLTKKSTNEYKFNKTLIRDEQADFVDHKFTVSKVQQLTGMKGDTLTTFMVDYRPAYPFVKKASEYDMINYIKDSYQRFKQSGFKRDDLFAKP
jgi:hypothetical protein